MRCPVRSTSTSCDVLMIAPMWVAANKVDGRSHHGDAGGRALMAIPRRSRFARRWLARCSYLEQRRTNVQTKTNAQELETIDSSQLSNPTGGKAKDTVAKVENGINKALPDIEKAATDIAGLFD